MSEHGQQGGADLHSIATAASAGFLSAADKIKLDKVGELTNAAPQAIVRGSSAVGVAPTAARADHKHDVVTGEPLSIAYGDSSEGIATALARADHKHAVAAPGLPSTLSVDAASAGEGAAFAREDHAHAVSTGMPVAVGSVVSEGTSPALARADHVHAHGDHAGGSLHACATHEAAGFLSADDKSKLDRIAEGAAALGSAEPPPMAAGSSAGVSAKAAREDHTHALSFGCPLEIGESICSEGTSPSAARSDHVHAHGKQGGGALHALATRETPGFMSPAHVYEIESARAEIASLRLELDRIRSALRNLAGVA